MQVFRWCSAKRGVPLGADGKANTMGRLVLLVTVYTFFVSTCSLAISYPASSAFSAGYHM